MEQEADGGWTWGGLITKTAMVFGAVLAAPVVLPYIGNILSSFAPTAAALPASAGALESFGFAAGKAADLAGSALNSVGQGTASLLSGVLPGIASVSGATDATVSVLGNSGAYLGSGVAQQELGSATWNGIKNVATQAGNFAWARPGAAAAIAGTGLVTGRMLSGAASPNRSFASAEMARRQKAATAGQAVASY